MGSYFLPVNILLGVKLGLAVGESCRLRPESVTASLQPLSSCTDLAWLSPVDAPQYRRADSWLPRGPVSVPSAIHLDVQIGPDSAGRGVGRALSAVLPRPRRAPSPSVLPAQGVHAPRGSLGHPRGSLLPHTPRFPVAAASTPLGSAGLSVEFRASRGPVSLRT